MSSLAEKRRAAGLSLDAMQKLTGINKYKLWRIERAGQPLQLKDARELARVLGCAPLDLCEEDAHQHGTALASVD